MKRFGMLQDVVRIHGGALAFTVALVGWVGVSVATLQLARHTAAVVVVSLSGAFLVLACPFSRPYRRSFRIASFGLLAILVGLEMTVRLAYFGVDGLIHLSHYGPYSGVGDNGMIRAEADARLAFGLTPGFAGTFMGQIVKVNADGFRGPAVPVRPSPEVFRVLAAGSSITMGAGVAFDDAFPAVLGRILNSRSGIPVESINWGIPAYPLNLRIERATAEATTYHPQAVVVELRGTEELLVGALGGDRSQVSELGRTEPSVSVFERFSFAVAGIYPPSSLRQRLEGLSARFSRSPVALSGMRAAPGKSPISRLAELSVLGRQRGFVVYALLVRGIASFAGPAPDAAMREQFRRQCDAAGVHLVDTFSLFGEDDLADDFMVFHGDNHPNARAHRRLATALADAMVPQLATFELFAHPR